MSPHNDSQFARMIAGKLYKVDDDLRSRMIENKRKIYEFNHLPPERWDELPSLAKKILGKTGENIYIEPPFHCDYGKNIEVGENFYANYNLVILDVAPVKIGKNVKIAPNVGIYTAAHPLDAAERATDWEFGKPITIGDDVWIGAGTQILPGVSIGAGTVIGAGSVVTKSVPANVIATGNPCRVLRKIVPADRMFPPTK